MPAVIAPFVQQHVDHSLCVCVCVHLPIIFKWHEETYAKRNRERVLFFRQKFSFTYQNYFIIKLTR